MSANTTANTTELETLINEQISFLTSDLFNGDLHTYQIKQRFPDVTAAQFANLRDKYHPIITREVIAPGTNTEDAEYTYDQIANPIDLIWRTKLLDGTMRAPGPNELATERPIINEVQVIRHGFYGISKFYRGARIDLIFGKQRIISRIHQFVPEFYHLSKTIKIQDVFTDFSIECTPIGAIKWGQVSIIQCHDMKQIYSTYNPEDRFRQSDCDSASWQQTRELYYGALGGIMAAMGAALVHVRGAYMTSRSIVYDEICKNIDLVPVITLDQLLEQGTTLGIAAKNTDTKKE